MSSKKQPYFPPPALPCTGVEAHAHMASKQFDEDRDEALKRAKAAGVARICQVYIKPDMYLAGKDAWPVGPDYPEVFFCLGVHPTESHLFSKDDLRRIEDFCRADSRIKAVGEVGLDYYWKECPPETQKEFFLEQIAMARRLDLPLVIHCREAEADAFAILEEQGLSGYPVLWHCFGGNVGMMERVVRNGWHLSIPGPVTYPANAALREAVAAAPLDRLLTETDCPYLSPVPLRGKRNEPANLGYAVDAMAKARNMDAAELWTRCGENAARFYRLNPLDPSV